VKLDASAALYLAARALTEAHPIRNPEGAVLRTRARWGAIANQYDNERRTYTVRVHVDGAPLTVYAIRALAILSTELQTRAGYLDLQLQPGGGYVEPTATGVVLVLA
jgi:hypothetical protein